MKVQVNVAQANSNWVISNTKDSSTGAQMQAENAGICKLRNYVNSYILLAQSWRILYWECATWLTGASWAISDHNEVCLV